MPKYDEALHFFPVSFACIVFLHWFHQKEKKKKPHTQNCGCKHCTILKSPELKKKILFSFSYMATASLVVSHQYLQGKVTFNAIEDGRKKKWGDCFCLHWFCQTESRHWCYKRERLSQSLIPSSVLETVKEEEMLFFLPCIQNIIQKY